MQAVVICGINPPVYSTFPSNVTLMDTCLQSLLGSSRWYDFKTLKWPQKTVICYISSQLLSRHAFILLLIWCYHSLSAAPEWGSLKVSGTKAGRRDEKWLLWRKAVWMALYTFRSVSTLFSPFSSSSFTTSFLPSTENSPTALTSGLTDLISEYCARASKALIVSCTRRTC